MNDPHPDVPASALITSVTYPWTFREAFRARLLIRPWLLGFMLLASLIYGVLLGAVVATKVAFTVFMFVVLLAIQAVQTRRQVRHVPGPMTIEFREETFDITGFDAHTAIPWGKTRTASFRRGFLMLALDPSGVFLVPQSSINPNQDTLIRNLLNRKGLLD